MDEAPGVRIVRIILIILAVILLISLIIWIFRPRTPDPIEEEPIDASSQQFSNVRYVQEGEITAPEEHNTIVITISGASRRIEVYRGYDAGPRRSDSFPNNAASYDQFYAALKSSGFFNSRENKNNLDRQGYCPLGIRYDYQAGYDIAVPSYNTWGASCSTKAGTFAGKPSTIKKLFTNQITDYSEFTKGVKL